MRAGRHIEKLICVEGTQEKRSRFYTKKIRLNRYVTTLIWTVEYRTMDYKLLVKSTQYPQVKEEEVTIIDLTDPKRPFELVSNATPDEAILALMDYKKCRVLCPGDAWTNFDGPFIRRLDKFLFERIGARYE